MTRTLFDDAVQRGLRVPTSCRRTGRCRECIVEVRGGAEHLSPPTAVEVPARAVPAGLPGRRRRPGGRGRVRDAAPPAAHRGAGAGRGPGPIDPVVPVADGIVHYGETPIEPLRGGVYGLAIDVGTTTVVLELVDLLTAARSRSSRSRTRSASAAATS